VYNQLLDALRHDQTSLGSREKEEQLLSLERGTPTGAEVELTTI
jgi:hypothetical protein